MLSLNPFKQDPYYPYSTFVWIRKMYPVLLVIQAPSEGTKLVEQSSGLISDSSHCFRWAFLSGEQPVHPYRITAQALQRVHEIDHD